MKHLILFVAIMFSSIDSYAEPVIEFVITSGNCTAEKVIDPSGAETNQYRVACEPSLPACVVKQIDNILIGTDNYFLYQTSIQDNSRCLDGCNMPFLVPDRSTL